MAFCLPFFYNLNNKKAIGFVVFTFFISNLTWKKPVSARESLSLSYFLSPCMCVCAFPRISQKSSLNKVGENIGENIFLKKKKTSKIQLLEKEKKIEHWIERNLKESFDFLHFF